MKSVRKSTNTFDCLREIVSILRGSKGCSWDKEQDHSSLRHNFLEECYEVLEALDSRNNEKIAEELGDVLTQIAFHVQIAIEKSEFSWSDLLETANKKLLDRHPHVFGSAEVKNSQEVEKNWNKIKKLENPEVAILDSVPNDMPALTTCALISTRAAHAGFEWSNIQGVIDKVNEEIVEFKNTDNQEEAEDEFGDLLFSLVNFARWKKLDAEGALRRSNVKFRQRFTHVEKICKDRGLALDSLSLAQKEDLWQEAKIATGTTKSQ